MSTDSSAGGLVGTIFAACDKAGVDCPINDTHPNSPAERGPVIYVKDPNSPPDATKKLQTALNSVDIDTPFVERSGLGADTFILFVGPRH